MPGARLAGGDVQSLPNSALDELTARLGDRLYAFTADQSFPKSGAIIVDKVLQRFGSFTALVNNAAIAADGVLATTRPDVIDNLIDVNIRAVLLLTRACTRHFLSLPRSIPKAVVNISSIVSITGFRGLSVYAATKSAMLGMT